MGHVIKNFPKHLKKTNIGKKLEGPNGGKELRVITI